MSEKIKPMMSLEDALTQLRDSFKLYLSSEKIGIDDSLGRVLSKDVVSQVNVPNFDNSAMDGFAIRHDDLTQFSEFKVVADVFAGHNFDNVLNPGECVRITTGAAIPEGLDSVVMKENTQYKDGFVSFIRPPRKYEAVRFCGEDIATGATIFKSGKRLTPSSIGVLASVGLSEVDVIARPKIALFSTGDELIAPGETLANGKIYDSNRYALKAELRALPVEIIDLGCLPDNPNHIENTLSKASKIADIIISSGGVSVGEADFVKDVLSKIGSLEFWKIAMKPGKPLAYGRIANAKFFGLPGNPVSALITFSKVVKPTLLASMGCIHETALIKAKATKPFKKRPGRLDFQRAIVEQRDGELTVKPTGAQSSGMLTSMTIANALAHIPADSGSIEVGEWVNVELLDN